MNITSELLAAYAQDNVSQEERELVRKYLAENPEQMEMIMMLADDGYDIDEDTIVTDEYLTNLDSMLNDIDSSSINRKSSTFLPMTAMAAQNMVDNLCVIRCEGIALRHFGIEISDDILLQKSEKQGWLHSEGTALHNIGRLSGTYGLSVSHRYHCNIDDIQTALSSNNIVIAAVDGNELVGDYAKEQAKDREIGLTPNHVVIVNSITEDSVTITDSATPQQQDTYLLSQFLDAWNDSSNYLTIISNSEEYIPHPINLDDVEVEEELIELREAIAENAHEVWAESRRNEGWTYGSVRDDAKKQNPDMLPYNLLPDSEKEYDRLMAMNTIKLVKKLGWEICRRPTD